MTVSTVHTTLLPPSNSLALLPSKVYVKNTFSAMRVIKRPIYKHFLQYQDYIVRTQRRESFSYNCSCKLLSCAEFYGLVDNKGRSSSRLL